MSTVSDLGSENKSNFNEDDDLFYFESEHLALRSNKDYSDMLNAIIILEAQRTEAIENIDRIIDIQKKALEDPATFIEKIKNKEDLGIPCSQKVYEIPSVDWSKYNVSIPEEAFKLINHEKVEEGEKCLVKKEKNINSTGKYNTHNKPWTSEEQKRLEELLVKFPPEAIEMRRYKKIAEALGNRTVKQVTSRVQKYFLKLYKAGLPIPGRIPKISDKKKSYSHKHQRHNAYLYKPSTFFPEFEVPVFMPENDECDDEASLLNHNFLQNLKSNNKETKSVIQIKIDLLKTVRAEKEREKQIPNMVHYGFKCDNCDEEPITGSRWHCYDCKQESVDFCTDCIVVQIQNSNTNGHPLIHNLQPVHEITGCPQNKSESVKDPTESREESDFESESSENEDCYDKDYILESTKTYNYLDPNFLPS